MYEIYCKGESGARYSCCPGSCLEPEGEGISNKPDVWSAQK